MCVVRGDHGYRVNRDAGLLPCDVVVYSVNPSIVDVVDRCPVHVGGVVYAIHVTRFAYGREVETVWYAGVDAMHEVARST